MGKPPALNISRTAILASVGGVVTASITLGPGINNDRGPATWHVTGALTKSSRPGLAPIPRVEVIDESGVPQGVSYDGSFGQGSCDITLTRSQFLTATWVGGNVGDVVTFALTGTKP